MVEPIAIIGMGCRFPGAPDLQAFWQLMCNGVDAITEVPTDRFDVQAFYHPQPATPGKIMSRWGGFLEQVDHFDAAFFGITPREAARMDPQHRLLLEVAWEAMEDAGQIPNKPSNTEAGVFIGIITSDYWDRQFRNPVDLDVYSTAGSARSGAAGRISYALGLQGISVAVDAACSSSLVAVHLACQSLRSGSCKLALAGGVNIILNPDHTIGYSQGSMMAPDGRCKTFDAQANGYVRSEGAGIVVLKPLSLALADGDPLYAIIQGSAANNDGHSDLFMTPSVQGQQAVLRQAYDDARRSPNQVQYVETHGTGTSVGDPVELKALGSILAQDRQAGQPCIVGSVKTNIGHTEGAAGLAGLIKVALCLKHKLIPQNLHFHKPNPAIPWNELPLVVAQELQAWPESDHPRLAGVSSFGIAGTNAHIVLEEAPSTERTTGESYISATSVHVLTLSAHSADALKEMARRYQAYLSKQEEIPYLFHDMCYTASVRKTHHDYRVAIVSHSREEAQNNLEAFLHNETSVDIVTGSTIARHSHKMVWVFPGQGSQWFGMGRDLFRQEPVFREMVERCDQTMRQYIDWSLLEEIQSEMAESHLDQVHVVQPMIFTIQVALATLWRSWGIEPDAVIGHSMGEVAAAYVAGALDLDDASRIICGRSLLLQRVSGKGAMAALELSLEHAKLAIHAYQDRVSIAVSNSPNSTVVSGEPTALANILAQMEQQGVFVRLVNVTVASHSPQMDVLRDDVLALLAPLQPGPSTIPLYSTVTGNICKGEDLDAAYWAQNLREPVLFLNTVQHLLEDRFDVFLEISPHPLLVGSIKETMHNSKHMGTVLASLRREEEGRTALLRSLGTLYTLAYPINWKTLYTTARQHVCLPTYPWQRERLWNTHLEDAQPSGGHCSRIGHPLLGPGIQSALQPGSYFWETTLNTKNLPYLSDHCIHGMVVLPSTGYIEMALAAATEAFGAGQFTIEDMVFKKTLFFPKERTQTVQITLTPEEVGTASLQIFSAQSDAAQQMGSWMLVACATICPQPTLPSQAVLQCSTPEQVRQEWEYTASAREHYQELRRRGIEHGPLFQGITHIWQHDTEAMAQITIPEPLTSEFPPYQFHPAVLDICLQVVMSLLPEDTEESTYVPITVEKVKMFQRPERESSLWSYATVRSDRKNQEDVFTGDILLVDESGQSILEVRGFCLQRLEGNTQQTMEDKLNRLLYTLHWEPTALVEQKRPQQVLSRKQWLILSEKGGIGQTLVDMLQAQGASCTVVYPGQAYTHVDIQQYEIDPTSPAMFQQLLTDAFVNTSQSCQGIVYLWGNTDQAQATTLQSLEAEQQKGSIAALYLVQAVIAAKWDILPRLWFVSSGAQAVHEADQVLSLAQSPLWGLGRVLVYEHPDLHTTLIDIDADCTPESREALCKEICSDDPADEIALRGTKRFVARLVHDTQRVSLKPVPGDAVYGKNGAEQLDLLPAIQDLSASAIHTQALFHADATYLLTGGLGGIGLKVAQWMIEQGAKHLVLIGRSGASTTAEKTIALMQDAGNQVKVVRGDIADTQIVANTLANIRECMPPLRGIFHCAVVLDDSILLQSNQERFLSVMRPKIHGTWNLHELTLDQPLDFFVLFSSAASLIGSPGQGNYAAANAFMDALAHYRRSRGYPALSINWGSWSEIGQATVRDRSKRLNSRGFASMKPQDALTILGCLLRGKVSQVGVMSFNAQKWCQFYPTLGTSSLLAPLIQEGVDVQAQQEGSRLTQESLLSMNTGQRLQATGTYLREQIAKVIGLSASKIDGHQQLSRLGIDSLMSVELKNRIASDLQVVVPVALFLQGITLEQLICHILQQIEGSRV